MSSQVLAAWILTTSALAAQTGAQIIDGLVVNSSTGSGIPGVIVSLVQNGSISHSATTNLQGHFEISGVRDGTYTANCKVPKGFWPVFHTGGRRPLLVAGAAVHLTIEMRAIPTISGRVLDAQKRPVPNAILWLQWKPPSEGGMFFQKKAGENGEFSIGDLPVQGAWLLSAMAPESWKPPDSPDAQRLGWAQTFYPGVTDPDLAGKLNLQPGEDLWNMDIKLAAVPVYRVRGVVLDPRGDPASKVTVSLSRGLSSPVPKQDTQADGAFEFGSVTEGEWRLSTTVNRDGRAAQEVQVKDHDLDLTLRLTPPFSLPGKVVMEVSEGAQAPKAPPLRLSYHARFSELESTPGGGIGRPDGNGDFTVGNCFPGRYRILSGDVPPPYYLDSIRLGSRDALESDVEILSGAEPLTLTYKSNGGTVRGTVEACGDGDVLLTPQDPALRHRPFIRQTPCGTDGRFEIPAVRPGEYYGLAVPTDDPAALFPGDLDQNMMNQSIRVSVRPGEATLVQPRVVRR